MPLWAERPLFLARESYLPLRGTYGITNLNIHARDG